MLRCSPYHRIRIAARRIFGHARAFSAASHRRQCDIAFLPGHHQTRNLCCAAVTPASSGGACERMTNQITTELALTEEEKTIFSTLLEASRSVGVNATLRVAGGWVRDKMLGKESGDIDIALDMMGKDFAEAVKEYLDSCGEGSGKVGVIQANPDQSKHLETATMKVHGVSIDFVNLRKETYASDSRIPEMEVGTAEEDAFRRDFTINSLFYNINEAAVEDKTGLGIDDLRAGLLRTPLDPKATFLDGMAWASTVRVHLARAISADSQGKIRSVAGTVRWYQAAL